MYRQIVVRLHGFSIPSGKPQEPEVEVAPLADIALAKLQGACCLDEGGCQNSGPFWVLVEYGT